MTVASRVAARFIAEIERISEYKNLLCGDWLKSLFPNMYKLPFSPHHLDFFTYIDRITTAKPPAYFLILGRGEGKDACAQGAVCYLGANERRKFALYICATQDLANKNVQTLAGMIEGSRLLSQEYPIFTDRQLTKYGHVKGWRVDMLRCANGFSVVALGLDASSRGLRLDEFRPDLMVFTDIDSDTDSPETIKKKITTLTRSILPAGSDNTVVMFLQNEIRDDGIIGQIVNNKADFLHNRIVTGPIPAIEGLQTNKLTLENGSYYYEIIGGTPTWPDKPLEQYENLLNEIGPIPFRIECQHEVGLTEGGDYQHVDFRYATTFPDFISICCAVDPAVTETGDKQAIQIDALGIDEKIYRLYSWEENDAPGNVVRQAIIKAVEYKADVIVFETDQGGDLWQESYLNTWQLLETYTYIKDWLQDKPGDWQELINNEYPTHDYDLEDVLEFGGIVTQDILQPDFVASRAGSVGSKKHRGQLQVNEYNAGRFYHTSNSEPLEAGLRRFPIRKPFDLHDAAFWSMWELIENTPAGN